MSLLDLFRRRRKVDGDNPLGDFDPGVDLGFSEGGTMPFQEEIAHLRWELANKAVEAARSAPNPELWDGGLMMFPAERSAAFGFEALRDKLANWVGAQIRDSGQEMISHAGDVALARDSLRNLDHKVHTASEHWSHMFEDLRRDEIELKRYYRMKSITSTYLKYAVAIFFILTELVISAQVFLKVFPNLPAGLEWLLALGVTIALIVIPHFTALGLKEGMTSHHQPEKAAHERDGGGVPVRVLRALSFEEMDDRIFRVASITVGLLLIAMVLPLSYLRATAETSPDSPFPWFGFLFLLLLQLALSGYFFLREWLNHGPLSEALYFVEKERDATQEVRESVYKNLHDSLADYHSSAEQLVFTIQQYPRWDSYIMASYHQSIWMFRSMVTQENPKLAVFINGATVPTLAGVPLDPASGLRGLSVAEELPILNDDGPCGRGWLMREANDHLVASTPDYDVDRPSIAFVTNGSDDGSHLEEHGSIRWPALKSPDELLGTYLGRYAGVPLRYESPEMVDLPPRPPSERIITEASHVTGEASHVTGNEVPPIDLPTVNPAETELA